MTSNKFVVGAALLVVGFVLGVIGIVSNLPQDEDLGGTKYDVQRFVGDVYNGLSDTLMMSEGFLVGPLKEPTETVTAANTLTVAETSKTVYLSTTGATTTLPAVADSAGVSYRFVVGAALATTNASIASAEGDNIEGTLIVAGAVVDCDAVDFVRFIIDGENLGDYVEFRSNGSKWFIGDSGALTASKLICSG